MIRGSAKARESNACIIALAQRWLITCKPVTRSNLHQIPGYLLVKASELQLE